MDLRLRKEIGLRLRAAADAAKVVKAVNKASSLGRSSSVGPRPWGGRELGGLKAAFMLDLKAGTLDEVVAAAAFAATCGGGGGGGGGGEGGGEAQQQQQQQQCADALVSCFAQRVEVAAAEAAAAEAAAAEAAAAEAAVAEAVAVSS